MFLCLGENSITSALTPESTPLPIPAVLPLLLLLLLPLLVAAAAAVVFAAGAYGCCACYSGNGFLCCTWVRTEAARETPDRKQYSLRVKEPAKPYTVHTEP